MVRLTSEGIAHLIERQMAMYRAQQRSVEAAAAGEPGAAEATEAGPPPYVAVSRQYGAGGSEFARMLAERLGFTLYDRELVEAIAHDAHLQNELLAPFDERERSNMEAWIRGLLTEETLSEHHYTKSLFRVLRSVAQVGCAVIVGRGAHLALPAETGLRIRIFAPPEYRVETVMAREGLSRHEAEEKITFVERSRQLWLIRAYGRAAKEPMAFDLALNPAAIPLATGVEIALTALRAKCGPLPAIKA